MALLNLDDRNKFEEYLRSLVRRNLEAEAKLLDDATTKYSIGYSIDDPLTDPPPDMETKDTHWLMRRCAISAGFYFAAGTSGRTAIQKAVERRELALGRPLDSFNELREALTIRSDLAWDGFLEQLSKDKLVIRNWGGTHWSTAQKPDLDGGVTTRETKTDTAETDKLRTKIREQQDIIGKMMQEAQKVDARIKEITERKPEGPLTIRIEREGKKTTTTLDLCHVKLPDLILRMKAHVNTYLVGPAGSGKTTAAEMAATALDLPFAFMSVGPQTTKTDILGYMNASGVYVTTVFRITYEKGGIFLFDELDAGNPGVLTCINAALAGSAASFPDGMVKRHKDFRCIAAGNTFGTGADRQYVGRQEMDAASIDRFNFLEWPYDEGLETALAAARWEHEDSKRWTQHVQSARKAVEKLHLRHVVSPRATLFGIDLLRAGAKWDDVETTHLWKSLKPDEVRRVREAMGEKPEVAVTKVPRGDKYHVLVDNLNDVLGGLTKLPDPL